MEDLGKKYSCSPTTIRSILKKNNIKIRPNKGENHTSWKGGTSFESYCPLFNKNFKERVRAFFNYTCPNCGKTEKENGQKLSVHHVTYNKKMCCEDDGEMGVPHLFIPLCKSCHPKTNFNREYWEELFYYIIIFEYNEECFIEKEKVK